MRTLKIALTAATLLGATAPAAPGHEELPLGPGYLQETRSSRWIAPGVAHTRIVRGSVDPRDAWTVDVAVVATRGEARTISRRLRELGHDARIERIGPRAQDDPQHGPLGFRVRTGRFTSQADADALRTRLVSDGFASPRSVYEGEDGERTTGPWVVNVLYRRLSTAARACCCRSRAPRASRRCAPCCACAPAMAPSASSTASTERRG